MIGKVTCLALYKKLPKFNSENYRPIYQTWFCCKLLEYIVFNIIMTHEDSYNTIPPIQHGFHISRSCEPHFLEFINVFKNIEDGKRTSIYKAFCKFIHSILLHTF